jgi:hypothetical protein
MNKVLIVLSFTLFACQNTKEKILKNELKDFFNTTITLDSLLNHDGSMCQLDTITLKLIVYYDAIDCVPCQLKTIPYWQQIIYEAAKYEACLQFIFIFNTSNEQEIAEIFEEHQFTMPVIYDPKQVFKRNNHLLDNTNYHTFLLDDNNKIILVGSPIGNSKLWNLYKQTIEDQRKKFHWQTAVTQPSIACVCSRYCHLCRLLSRDRKRAYTVIK